MKIKVNRIEEVVGEVLEEWEVNKTPYSISGADEVILNFSDGKEIVIFVNEDGELVVEGD